MAMSEKGVKESIKIAENAVKDAKEALKHRERELEDYIVRAPGSGVIERILINPREYNQDSGKPGFVIASGRWFEAHFDQSDFSGVSPGLETQIHLEAFPGRLFTGRINLIIPVVSFNQGGPEISRPMRPRGSGAAEWAATFRTQINFENDEEEVALGMTGFARIRIQREGLAVPRGALISISAGSGYVNVVDAEDKWQSRLVEVGIVEETKAEILSGLVKGDRVIVRGHWVLEPGDAIGVVRTWDGFISPDKP
jgi:multidrug efflux pump subunit AcrA (membrane-fusion protein)